MSRLSYAPFPHLMLLLNSQSSMPKMGSPTAAHLTPHLLLPHHSCHSFKPRYMSPRHIKRVHNRLQIHTRCFPPPPLRYFSHRIQKNAPIIPRHVPIHSPHLLSSALGRIPRLLRCGAINSSVAHIPFWMAFLEEPKLVQVRVLDRRRPIVECHVIVEEQEAVRTGMAVHDGGEDAILEEAPESVFDLKK